MIDEQKRKLFLELKQFIREKRKLVFFMDKLKRESYGLQIADDVIFKLEERIERIEKRFQHIYTQLGEIGLDYSFNRSEHVTASEEFFNNWAETFLGFHSVLTGFQIKEKFITDTNYTISTVKLHRIMRQKYEHRRLFTYKNGAKSSVVVFLINPNMNGCTDKQLKEIVKL